MLMCILTGISVFLKLKTDNTKIAVVDATKLFSQYNMTKELEGKAKIKLLAMGKQMDSVETLLNTVKALKNENEINRLSNVYAYYKDKLEDQYTQSNREINELVWKRLNKVIDDYGKKKGLHLIIGANGMGSVLYNDDYYDLTNDAVIYVNKNYEEGN